MNILSSQTHGPFQVKSVLGNNSYKVQQSNKPEAATRKYKDTDLYLLTPAIFPHKLLNTTNLRFFDYSHAPIISPIHKTLRIEMYNDMYFNSSHLKQKFELPRKYQVSDQVDMQAFKTYSKPKIPPTK